MFSTSERNLSPLIRVRPQSTLVLEMEAIAGSQLCAESFRVVTSKHKVDAEILNELFSSTRSFAAYLIKRATSADTCHRIRQAFEKRINCSGGHRPNDSYVNVDQIGTTQFGKNASDYANQSKATTPQIDDILNTGSKDPYNEVLHNQAIGEAARRNHREFRPATHQGAKACPCVIRSWKNPGDLSLEAHEDKAQLAKARHEGFEIGNVDQVIAQNLTITNGQGGNLRIWNLAPNENMRKQLNLENEGYPYPTSTTNQLKHIDIQTETGDLLFIAANHLHAVTTVRQGNRITLGRFLGQIPNTIITWT